MIENYPLCEKLKEFLDKQDMYIVSEEDGRLDVEGNISLEELESFLREIQNGY